MSNDEKWMNLALKQAIKAGEEGEVPVGAIIVKDDYMIAKAHNQPISKNDPTAHAEIQVLRIAGEIQKNYRFVDSTLYVTLEPCTMCLGAMIHARINRIVFGAYDPNSGVCGSCIDLQNEKIFNHKIIITGGILEQNCKKLLYSFFKNRRR